MRGSSVRRYDDSAVGRSYRGERFQGRRGPGLETDQEPYDAPEEHGPREESNQAEDFEARARKRGRDYGENFRQGRPYQPRWERSDFRRFPDEGWSGEGPNYRGPRRPADYQQNSFRYQRRQGPGRDALERERDALYQEIDEMIDRKADLENLLDERSSAIEKLATKEEALESELADINEENNKIRSKLSKLLKAQQRVHRSKEDLKRSESKLRKVAEEAQAVLLKSKSIDDLDKEEHPDAQPDLPKGEENGGDLETSAVEDMQHEEGDIRSEDGKQFRMPMKFGFGSKKPKDIAVKVPFTENPSSKQGTGKLGPEKVIADVFSDKGRLQDVDVKLPIISGDELDGFNANADSGPYRR